MNVLETLHQELKGKNWTIEEKAYYIYIRSCQLFSYDERYDFCQLFNDNNELKNKIINRKIDLENVDDFRVICTSHSDEVLSKLFKELVGIDCLSEGIPQIHKWLKFYDGTRYMEVDSTSMSDLQRVKMGLKTYGYKPLVTDCDFDDNLKQMAKTIHYIDEDYQTVLFENRKKQMFQDFVNSSVGKEFSKQSDDYLLYRLNVIRNLFYSFSGLQRFSDAEFCISYLFHKFLENDKRHLGNIYLFQNIKDNDWNFVNIYPIKLNDERLYFMLGEKDKTICFEQIDESDVTQYTKMMRGLNKDII